MAEPKTPASSIAPERIARVDALVRAMQSAIKASAMYPPQHPSLVDFTKTLEVAMQAWLRFEGRLTLAFTPDSVRLDNTPVKPQDPTFRAMADYVHKRGLLGLTVERGVTTKEVAALLDAVKDMPEAIAEAGGIAKRLRASPHITVKEIDYSALLAASRARDAADPARLWESLCALVAPLEKDAKSAKWTSILDRLKDAGATASALNGAYEQSEDREAAAARIWKVVGSISREGSALPPRQAEVLRQSLAVIVTKLNPELVQSLFMQGEGELSDLQDTVLDNLPDEAVADMIVSMIDQEGKIDRQLVGLFGKMSARRDRSDPVAAMVAEQVMKSAKTASGEGLHEMQAAIREAFTSAPKNAFLSRVYELTVEKLPVSISSRALTPALAAFVADYERMMQPAQAIVQKTLLLLNLLWLEEDPEHFRRMMHLLVECMEGCADEGRSRLMARDALVMCLAKLSDAGVHADIARDAREGVLRVIRLIGAATLASLVVEVPAAEFEGLGPVLGADTDVHGALVNAFLAERSENARQKLSAVLASMNLTAAQQIRTVLRLLGRERSVNVRTSLWAAALRNPDPRFMEGLFKAVGRGLFGRRRLLELIQQAGAQRSTAAVPALGDLLATRPRVDWCRRHVVRTAAAVSLGQIGTEEAMQWVQGAMEDPQSAVRGACLVAVAAARPAPVAEEEPS